MITPSWNDGPDIWFTLSDGLNYDVSLMHTQLTPVGAPSAPTARHRRRPFAQASGTAKLSWTAPAKINASKVTGYVVTAYYAADPTYEEHFSLPPVTFKSTATDRDDHRTDNRDRVHIRRRSDQQSRDRTRVGASSSVKPT